MKKCPQCGREYDNTMMFCLDDGAELLYGPARSEPGAGGAPAGASPSGVQVATGFPPADEPQTAFLSEPPASAGGQFDEAKTRAFTHTTLTEAEPQGTLGGLAEKHSFSAQRAAKPLLAVSALAVLVLGGFLGYRYITPAKQISSIAIMQF
jgi:hypothetical protein